MLLYLIDMIPSNTIQVNIRGCCFILLTRFLQTAYWDMFHCIIVLEQIIRLYKRVTVMTNKLINKLFLQFTSAVSISFVEGDVK